MSGWKRVGEWTIADRPDCLFEVEEYRDGDKQMVFVHLHVWKFNKAVLKELRRCFSLFRECVPAPLYACGSVDDDKFFHFITSFGFQPLCMIPCTDGKTRRLFIHIKNSKKNELQIRRTKEHAD